MPYLHCILESMILDSCQKLAKAAAAAAVTPGATSPAPPVYETPRLSRRPAAVPLLAQQRACFVYITQKPGRTLRGIFGTALPQHRTLGEEIIRNAAAAATSGSHGRLRRADLPMLQFTVAVLDPLSRISHPAQLDPHLFGLYVVSDRGKSALLMPQRPGITTAADQIATAVREAGISMRQEAVTMYRFRVEYHDEE
ncbi:MAG: hypothetical protein COT71_02850 [Candidatus Andersenbacteria bacterium CG10_big_fil_rev_8_21_14_0_10_54_11]|uniref:AMMECR1 domain-containing protein n=1 Tax=Candidatus Andersenbacteria bacterium CG10_big_fil_rev_8_21_14_0_10_54_11 TaxID=1974485 RepID=A0A2M6WZ68_9BACT|nr:MAG: hypothetical protein COT71_02850 [Candidatus Andersenbacteria bacterium CG10_big_fil_rev_8_21_14_0_10_54_11]